MANSAMQLELSSATSVASNANVLFNNVVYSSGGILYDTGTGVITFTEAGRFVIDWWLATQFTASTNGTSFALESSQGDSLLGNSPLRTGEVYGVGIIEVTTPPVNLSLVNVSDAAVTFASIVPLTGALVIVEDDFTSEGPTGDTAPCI